MTGRLELDDLKDLCQCKPFNDSVMIIWDRNILNGVQGRIFAHFERPYCWWKLTSQAVQEWRSNIFTEGVHCAQQQCVRASILVLPVYFHLDLEVSVCFWLLVREWGEREGCWNWCCLRSGRKNTLKNAISTHQVISRVVKLTWLCNTISGSPSSAPSSISLPSISLLCENNEKQASFS